MRKYVLLAARVLNIYIVVQLRISRTLKILQALINSSCTVTSISCGSIRGTRAYTGDPSTFAHHVPELRYSLVRGNSSGAFDPPSTMPGISAHVVHIQPS